MKFSPPSIRNTFLLILALNLCLHFIGLNHPDTVVFDEVHFGKFVTAYCCKHDRIFDIHPPHPKLLIALAVKIAGYDGKFDFDHIGEAYEDVSQMAFRFFPALEGSLIPPVLFLLMLQLGASYGAAIFAALFISLDNGFLVQSRIIAMDPLLILSMLSAILICLKALGQNARGRNTLFFLSGGAAGLAVGSKFTGLTALALMGLLFAEHLRKHFEKKALGHAALMGLGFIVVYLAGWVVHFVVLTEPGYADQFYKLTGSFWTDLFRLNQTMLNANVGLKASHSDGSQWWQWLMNEKPVYYWVKNQARIYFVGNPVVWWGSSIGVIGSILYWMVRRGEGAKKALRTRWIIGAAFIISFLPYFGIKRVLFLYHYMPPLIFAVMLMAFWMDDLALFNAPRRKISVAVLSSLLLILIFGFIVVSPMTFGYEPFGWQLPILQFLSPSFR